MKRTTFVTTTIRVPTFLEGLCENAARNGHRNLSGLVIGDQNTPPEARRLCETLTAKFRIPVTYLDLREQEEALASYPELLGLIPMNSGSRKFIGSFLAYLRGCEALIFIDDDNFVTDIDFVGWHEVVGTAAELDLIASDTGWFNIYESVVEARGIPFFPRGYPWGQRQNPPPRVERRRETRRVIANSGLVLDDPDVDAVSRLFWPIRVVEMAPEWRPRFGLAPGTWSPFNDQNAAYGGELVPIYFAPPSTGRNADIWGSYVVNRLVEHFGDAVSFGYPVVRQIRNPHDLWKDLEMELVNDRATDRFVALLRSVPLSAASYADALGELLAGGLEGLASLGGMPETELRMMGDFFTQYQTWHGVASRAARERGVTEPRAAR